MADTKLTALTEDTTPSASGLIYYVDDPTGSAASRKVTIENFLKAYYAPSGTMLNGKLVVSVASNNLTVALKTLAGADASAADPVIVNINGTVRTCTAALSVTRNAATNWCNAGAAELATKEIDYFAYLIWNTTPATDIIDIGFSRMPYYNIYSEASSTTTSEKYIATANGSAPTSTDDMVVIGRFAATLSAGAGYTWSVPTFTSSNLVQHPIYETRALGITPTFANFTVGNATLEAYYKIVMKRMYGKIGVVLGNTSSMGTAPTVVLPLTPSNLATTYEEIGQMTFRDTGTALYHGVLQYVSSNTASIAYYKVNGTAIEEAAVAATVPMTWASTDEFSMKYDYEIA
jgi:hypothetical protein